MSDSHFSGGNQSLPSEELQSAVPHVTGAPDRIVLCVGDIPVNTPFGDLQDVTWCASSQNNADIEYVRADLCTAPQAEMTPPEVLASRLIDTWCAAHGAQIPWEKAVEISAIVTKMPDAEYARLLRLDDTSPQTGAADLEQVYDAFGIGSQARTLSTLLTNIGNTKRFSEYLDAVEREFFMVPGASDEDDPDAEPDDECLVNRWGSTQAQYVEQFRNALQTIASKELTDNGEAAYPAKCPITRRDFFMVIDHPDLGMVPTYGGPFDSYTIPEMEGEPDQEYHERGLLVHRYDHDEGAWVDDESIGLRVINEDTLHEFMAAAEQPSEDKRELLTAASHALRSYQYGNAAPDLAEAIADRIDAAIAKGEAK